jgi:hypothetical protein
VRKLPVVVAGFDLSLTGPALVVLGPGWSPVSPMRGLDAHDLSMGKEARLSARIRGIVKHALLALSPHWDQESNDVRVFVEQHAFASMGSYALERAELVGALEYALREEFGLSTGRVVASSARKLVFGKMPRMRTKEWKKYIELELPKMGVEIDDEDQRDAFVVANAGRYELGLPCLAHGD